MVNLVPRAEKIIGRDLARQYGRVILEAHSVGYNELGKDRQTPAVYNNYNDAQKAAKVEILTRAGMSWELIDALWTAGILGVFKVSQ